jgi:hypothetical protein
MKNKTVTIKEIRELVHQELAEMIGCDNVDEWYNEEENDDLDETLDEIEPSDSPSHSKSAEKKRLHTIGGKKFATKVKRGFEWADDPEAAAAAAMRRAGTPPKPRGPAKK